MGTDEPTPGGLVAHAATDTTFAYPFGHLFAEPCATLKGHNANHTRVEQAINKEAEKEAAGLDET